MRSGNARKEYPVAPRVSRTPPFVRPCHSQKHTKTSSDRRNSHPSPQSRHAPIFASASHTLGYIQKRLLQFRRVQGESHLLPELPRRNLAAIRSSDGRRWLARSRRWARRACNRSARKFCGSSRWRSEAENGFQRSESLEYSARPCMEAGSSSHCFVGSVLPLLMMCMSSGPMSCDRTESRA